MDIILVDPLNTPWARWASDLSEQLASYNAPNPGPEDSWAAWAAQIVALPEVAELGAPNPEMFADWRGWACSLLQVLS